MMDEAKQEIVKIPRYSERYSAPSCGSTRMGIIFDNWKGPDKVYQIGNGPKYKPVVDEKGIFQSLKVVD